MAIGTPVAEAFVRLRPDASGFGRELQREVTPQVQRVERSLRASERELGRFSRGAVAGAGLTRSFGRSVAFASTAFLGTAGLTHALRTSVDVAEEFGKASRGLTAQLRANNESVQEAAPLIAEANAQMAKLGITSAESELVLARLARATGSVSKATQLMGLTADLAASRHISLAQSAIIVGKVVQGNTTAFNRGGLVIAKGTSVTDALRIATEKLAGQAEAAVTPLEKLHAGVFNLEVGIGEALLPTINAIADRLNKWVANTDNVERVQRDLTHAVHTTTTVLGGFETVIHDVDRATGSLKETVKLLGLAWLGLKFSRVVIGLGAVETAAYATATAETALAGAAGAADTALLLGGAGSVSTLARTFAGVEAAGVTAATAATRVGLMTRALGALSSATVAPIVAAVTLAVTYEVTTKILKATGGDGLLRRFGGREYDRIQSILGHSNPAGPISQQEIDAAVRQLIGPVGPQGVTRVKLTDADFAPAGPRGPVGTPATTTGQSGEPSTGIPWLDNLLARAEATAGRGNDERVLRRIQAVLRARLARAKSLSGRTKIQQALNQFTDQLAGLTAEDAQAIQDRLDAKNQRIADAADLAARRERSRISVWQERQAEFAAGRQRRVDRLAARVQALTQTPAGLTLEEQIAAQNAKTEKDLLPVLQKERASAIKRLAIVEDLEKKKKASANDVLQAELTLATVNRRIRDIKQADKAAAKGFSLTDLYAEAGNELALYGSNIGPAGAPLSRQDAHAGLATIVQSKQFAIVQHFHGERNPAQAITEAARAAQAVR